MLRSLLSKSKEVKVMVRDTLGLPFFLVTYSTGPFTVTGLSDEGYFCDRTGMGSGGLVLMVQRSCQSVSVIG